METKNADQHGSSAYGIGDEPTVNTSGGDGCGFSALRQRKRRTESENDAEVEPVIEEDGTACKRSSGDHGPSEKVSAAPQIPEYVWFNMFDVVCVCVCVCDIWNAILCISHGTQQQCRSDPLPHPTPSQRPSVGTQTLVSLNFSAMVAPLATSLGYLAQSLADWAHCGAVLGRSDEDWSADIYALK